MTWGRRTTVLLALPAIGLATGPVLAGCGDRGAEESAPPPVVIPGSTVTIGTEPPPTAATDGAEEIPTETSAPDAEDDPPPGGAATPTDLLALVGGAMAEHETVRLTIGDGTTPALEADYTYLGGTDFVAELDVPGAPTEVRRVDGTSYVSVDGGAFVEVPTAEPGDGSIVPALARWDVLLELRDLIENAQDLVAAGPGDVDGVEVTTYEFTVEAAEIAEAANVPDLLTGPVDVTFSVAADGLPVRVDQVFGDGDQLLRTDYDAWGEPVDVEAPDVG